MAEAKASKEARIVAETICKEAIKYMEQLRPYKMKYNQLLRRNGINGVTSSLSDLLRVVPKEVLAGWNLDPSLHRRPAQDERVRRRLRG